MFNFFPSTVLFPIPFSAYCPFQGTRLLAPNPRCAMWLPSGTLSNVKLELVYFGQKHSGIAHVFVESLPEFLAQKSLLTPCLEVESDQDDCKSEPSAEIALD